MLKGFLFPESRLPPEFSGDDHPLLSVMLLIISLQPDQRLDPVKE